MGEEKRPFGVRLEPELYAALESRAKHEKRSPANLGELLIEWAMKQLNIAGSTIVLLDSTITVGVASHAPKHAEYVTKDRQLDNQVGANLEATTAHADRATEQKRKTKTHRSKAS